MKPINTSLASAIIGSFLLVAATGCQEPVNEMTYAPGFALIVDGDDIDRWNSPDFTPEEHQKACLQRARKYERRGNFTECRFVLGQGDY